MKNQSRAATVRSSVLIALPVVMLFLAASPSAAVRFLWVEAKGETVAHLCSFFKSGDRFLLLAAWQTVVTLFLAVIHLWKPLQPLRTWIVGLSGFTLLELLLDLLFRFCSMMHPACTLSLGLAPVLALAEMVAALLPVRPKVEI